MYSSKQQLRSLMESIEAIEEQEEDQSHDVEHHSDAGHKPKKAQEVIKSIISTLKNITERVVNGDIDDNESLVSDLQHIHDSLDEIGGEEKHSEDERVDGEKGLDEDEDVDVSLSMSPKGSEGCTPDYSDPKGSSYPARQGFTGI